MTKISSEKTAALRAAFPYTLPVLTGFAFLGLAYGVLMSTKGYGPLWSLLMSAVVFGGSIQFVAVTMLTTVFNPWQAFLLAMMVNARHLFYGLSMLHKYQGMGKIKYLLIYTLCDETFSIACATEPPPEINRKYFYFFISFLDYSYWVLGSFMGGVLGNIITFNTKGLDFVLTALFVVIFLKQWQEQKNHTPAIIGILSSLLCLFIFGPDNFIIPSMITILIILTIIKNKAGYKKCT